MLQLGIVLLITSIVIGYTITKTSMQIDEQLQYVRKADKINFINSKQSIDSIYNESLIDSKEKLINIKVSDIILDINNNEKDIIDRFQRAVEIAVNNNIEKPTCTQISDIKENNNQIITLDECNKILNMEKNFIEIEKGEIVLNENEDIEVLKSLNARYDLNIESNGININNGYSLEAKSKNSEKVNRILSNAESIIAAIANKPDSLNTASIKLSSLSSEEDDSIKSKLDISDALLTKSTKYVNYYPKVTSSSIDEIQKNLDIIHENILLSDESNSEDKEKIELIKERSNDIDTQLVQYIEDVETSNIEVVSILDTQNYKIDITDSSSFDNIKKIQPNSLKLDSGILH